MSVVLTNNAVSSILSISGTTLEVAAGSGALFPNPTGTEWFPLTLIKADGTGYEIVRATARSGDTITIARAQEGTAQLTFAAGDFVELRLTEAALRDLVSSGVTNVETLTASASNGGTDRYAAAISSVTAYTDGLEVKFIAHATNTGESTLRINSLAEVELDYSDGASVVDLYAGAILIGRTVCAHYDTNTSKFIVDNVAPPAAVNASTTTSGVVQLSTETTFDESGDNTRATTQATVSSIVEDRISRIEGVRFDPKWSNYGRGIRGDIVISSDQNLLSGDAYETRSFTVNAGQQLTFVGGHTTVIQAQVEIVINGRIVLEESRSEYPLGFVGPRGVTSIGATGSRPDVFPSQIPYSDQAQDEGDGVSGFAFDMAVIDGVDFQLFHGGHGRGGIASDLANGFTRGRNGLILIAPRITISSTAEISMPSVVTPPANLPVAGDGGGGILVTSTEELILDPGADFVAGDGVTAPISQPATSWNGAANAGEAGNAQFYAIDLSTNNIANIF